MTQEDKELLLQDLCGRLPYGVKVSINQSQLQNYDSKWKNWGFEEEPEEIDGVSIYGVTFGCMDMSDGVIGFEFIKPHLFPLSSMTEEQKKELKSLLRPSVLKSLDEDDEDIEFPTLISANPSVVEIDYYNKNHFDYRGLIPMGLANDATGLNIY